MLRIFLIILIPISALAAAPDPNDDPQILLGTEIPILEEIAVLDQIRRGAISEQTWVGPDWHQYEGGPAIRYADPLFPRALDWQVNRDYILSHPVGSVPMNELSAAEKYDLLMGDAANSLANYNWEKSRRYYKFYGFLPSWWGYCHGWAAASLNTAVPIQSVTVTSPTNQLITFSPTDIKGLLSLLWGEGAITWRMLGENCSDKNPIRDKNGRPYEQSCFDTNPASWHKLILNQIGVRKKGFVADLDASAEIWNFPVTAFSYSYFNPKSGVATTSLAAASVKRSDFPSDAYKLNRARNSTKLVGVQMIITYTPASEPITDALPGPRPKKMQFSYVLELTEDGKILGGEWTTAQHPDFLWITEPGANPASPISRNFNPDDWHEVVPESWRTLSPALAAKGEPLAAVVEKLLELSRRSRP